MDSGAALTAVLSPELATRSAPGYPDANPDARADTPPPRSPEPQHAAPVPDSARETCGPAPGPRHWDLREGAAAGSNAALRSLSIAEPAASARCAAAALSCGACYSAYGARPASEGCHRLRLAFALFLLGAWPERSARPGQRRPTGRGPERGLPRRGAGHNARVFDLAFAPAGRDLLATGSDDETAKVWRLRAGAGGGARDPDARAERASTRRAAGVGGRGPGGEYEQVASFHGHADSVLRVAWAPDGALLASGARRPRCATVLWVWAMHGGA